MDKQSFGIGIISGVLLTFGLSLVGKYIYKNKTAKQQI